MKKLIIVGLVIAAIVAIKVVRVNSVPVTTCQWPNTCAQIIQKNAIAQIQPCVWPNHCNIAL